MAWLVDHLQEVPSRQQHVFSGAVAALSQLQAVLQLSLTPTQHPSCKTLVESGTELFLQVPDGVPAKRLLGGS